MFLGRVAIAKGKVFCAVSILDLIFGISEVRIIERGCSTGYHFCLLGPIETINQI